MSTMTEGAAIILIGRSSSSFTRVARIFADELGVAYAFRSVPNLMSLDPQDYGGHPALKVPVLQVNGEVWFGATNICRVLARLSSGSGSTATRRVVWPEDLHVALAANAQEMALQAMTTEVTLIMAQLGEAGAGSAHTIKLRRSLLDSLAWLNDNIGRALAALPAERDLSFLEVTLYCLVTHLEFREVLSVEPYKALVDFRTRFGERPSAQATAFRFDA
jgi:glutathione S-transferase